MVNVNVKLSKKELSILKKNGYTSKDISNIKDEIKVYGRNQLMEYLPYKKNMFKW